MGKLKKRKMGILLVIGVCILLGALFVWIGWGNSALETTYINLDILPGDEKMVIAQVSDLHNAQFGPENETLLKMLEDTKPDEIVVTGDLIDSRKTNFDIAENFLRRAQEIAHVTYVTGNHEARIQMDFSQWESKIHGLNVSVLHNQSEIREINGVALQIIGLDDPTFGTEEALYLQPEKWIEKTLDALLPRKGQSQEKTIKILLAHRPEYIQVYEQFDVDLVLSGHAHGGQIRLPLLGGVYAPGQGFFPEYDGGLYHGSDGNSDTALVVSRGLGNSLFPWRVNNRPELVVIQLT